MISTAISNSYEISLEIEELTIIEAVSHLSKNLNKFYTVPGYSILRGRFTRGKCLQLGVRDGQLVVLFK